MEELLLRFLRRNFVYYSGNDIPLQAQTAKVHLERQLVSSSGRTSACTFLSIDLLSESLIFDLS